MAVAGPQVYNALIKLAFVVVQQVFLERLVVHSVVLSQVGLNTATMKQILVWLNFVVVRNKIFGLIYMYIYHDIVGTNEEVF